MGTCINHKDRKTSCQCMKHGVYLCEDCLRCRDPELYCKFRAACPIHFMDKKGGKDWLEQGEEKEKRSHTYFLKMVDKK